MQDLASWLGWKCLRPVFGGFPLRFSVDADYAEVLCDSSKSHKANFWGSTTALYRGRLVPHPAQVIIH